VTISREGKGIFKKFCVIAYGIPAVLLAFTLILYFSPWDIDRTQASNAMLNVTAACLAAAGVGIWAFLGHLMYRRLWRIFPYIAEPERAWSYAEGVFGLLGVGASMMSVLGVFYYLFTGDIMRSIIFMVLSFMLAVVETARFPGRLDEVERIIAGIE
jgi:hypothetical protein